MDLFRKEFGLRLRQFYLNEHRMITCESTVAQKKMILFILNEPPKKKKAPLN